jgi:16S rRNA (uracil1498-N3)-methyltransferase
MMRWVIEGSKQSGRNVLMELCDATSWTGFLQTFSTAPMRLVADRTGVPLDSVLQQATASNVVLAVGPEGGFTTAELITAEERAWRLVNLGRRILRVETAEIAIVSRIAGDN